jgi:hypothetical protein
LLLTALAVAVLAICDMEAALAARRWDPEDMGRTPDISARLLPGDARPQGESALVTIRVETPEEVRVYQYRVDGSVADPKDLLRSVRALNGTTTSAPGMPRSGGSPAPQGGT